MAPRTALWSRDMDPEATSTPTTEATTTVTPPAAPAQQPPAPRVYSEEEVNAIRQQERNAAAAAARREAEARLKPKAEAPRPEKTDAPVPQDQPVDDYETRAARRSQFDRAIGRANLNEEQIALLEVAYRAERPADPVDWVSRKSKAFGIPSATTTTQPSPTATSATPPAPTAPQPAPSTAVPNVNADDVSRWNERQWSAYVQQHGANPGNPYHWSNVKVHQELAQKYAAAMANKLIVTKKT